MREIDKFRGCLIGGAAGDALGYAVEFRTADRIFAQYGENGITEYALNNGVAEISDDTQMTLFTANGLLIHATRKEEPVQNCIYLSAAALAHIVRRLTENEPETVLSAVTDAMRVLPMLIPETEHLHEMLELMQKAVKLADTELDDLDAIRQLGGGWVGEETLAIAIYCAVKYENNFEKALIASVNHDGDSDSTGAVTGNILGARLGYDAIPLKFIEKLELRDVILEIADDLRYAGENKDRTAFDNPQWIGKYVKADYTPH